MSALAMAPRSRWTKPRVARAAFLAGGGATAREIAADPIVASHPAHVGDRLRSVGIALSDAPKGSLTVGLPRKLLRALEAMARKRGQTAEALGGAVLAILAGDPVLLANVLDDDV